MIEFFPDYTTFVGMAEGALVRRKKAMAVVRNFVG